MICYKTIQIACLNTMMKRCRKKNTTQILAIIISKEPVLNAKKVYKLARKQDYA